VLLLFAERRGAHVSVVAATHGEERCATYRIKAGRREGWCVFHLPGFSDLWQMSLRFQTASRSVCFHLASSLGNSPIKGKKKKIICCGLLKASRRQGRTPAGLHPGPAALLLPPLLPILPGDRQPHACPGPPQRTGKTTGRSPMACAPPASSPHTPQGDGLPLTLPPNLSIKENSFPSSKKIQFSCFKTDQGEKDKCPGASCHGWDVAGSVTAVTLRSHLPPLPTSMSCLSPDLTRRVPAVVHC